jgi:predicted N-acetyltransferase YhbS
VATTSRPYAGDTDFMLLRDFLSHTYALQGPVNWTIERWNFCRYFVVPLHTFYNVRFFGVPTLTHPPIRDELPLWEKTVRLWENARGEVVGFVTTENEEPGEVWIQTHPQHLHLVEEMLDWAEGNLVDQAAGLAYLKVYCHAGSTLERTVVTRGYTRIDEPTVRSQFDISGEEVGRLPDGFVFRTVAEKDDVDARRRARAMAFGPSYPPSDWPPAEIMRMMQQAPDYRPELDFLVESDEGECVALATAWLDEANHYAVYEPVCTVPRYQGRGIGRAMLHQGFRRLYDAGARRSFMDLGNPFYERIGFVRMDLSVSPWIRYQDV